LEKGAPVSKFAHQGYCDWEESNLYRWQSSPFKQGCTNPGRQYFWFLSTKHAACHPSGAQNFEVPARLFLENLCNPALKQYILSEAEALHCADVCSVKYFSAVLQEHW